MVLVKTNGSHFRRVVQGENIMTPNLIGFYKIEGGEAEISRGKGIWGDEIYGVTVVKDGKNDFKLSKVVDTLSDAQEYVKTLM